MKLSKQPCHRGIVVLSKFDADGKGFGFIEPAGSDGSRESNVFFNGASTRGLPLERGDEVSFVYSTKPHERGPAAYRVWLRKRAVENDREEITTIRGEFEA
jgi:cold shock CspA family protein